MALDQRLETEFAADTSSAQTSANVTTSTLEV